ncbi:MAG: BCD family MFS transporter [Gammaproteobacteria bacterium]|nr:BCD family MFS transporter [Gammaproteobacteria bacterium]
MKRLSDMFALGWKSLDPKYLPFADAATDSLPMSRLLRLALFQISAGMAIVLLNGTLNRVMVLEMNVPTWLVSLMVSLPLLFAPFRALIGHRSDHHRSLLGWRRVPYIWLGTMLQFGGLAIMPFALLVLSTPDAGPAWLGYAGAALAFLLVGAGLHTHQTAGLALATDLAPPEVRHRVVALLFVMLLLGMFACSLVFSLLLQDFSPRRLTEVIQGAAVLTMVLNVLALWKQESRNPARTSPARAVPGFAETWRRFREDRRVPRLLIAVGLGTAGFSMQDILLEPYGGEILKLSVAATTGLTALFAGGMLIAFAVASRALGRGKDPARLAGFGALAGTFAFAAVILSGTFESALLFRCGTLTIGFGAGLFSVGTLTFAMTLAERSDSGIALGAWGAVNATAAGLAIALGGALRDAVTGMAERDLLGPALTGPITGYGVVYHVEILLLFATLVAIGPLTARSGPAKQPPTRGLGLADFPN